MSDSHASPARCAMIPWGLLGMLALVGAIERSWFHENLAFSNGLGHGWRGTALQVKKEPPGAATCSASATA